MMVYVNTVVKHSNSRKKADITFQNRHIVTLAQALILDWVLKVFVTDEELIPVNLKEFQYPLLTRSYSSCNSFQPLS